MTAMERIAGLALERGPSAERIDILHFDLAGSIADIPPGIPGTEVLIIFWRGDIPAGHAYVLRGRTGHVPSVGLMRNVAPARSEAEPPGQSQLVKKTLSVVVCTRDRPGALWRCLRSLSRQKNRPDQILVVDNASRDEAAEDIASVFGADYAREERPGLDYARNRGARQARGEIVAFVDDDVAVHPDWTEQTIAAFDHRAIMAVTGLVLPAELETHAQIIFEAQWGFGRGYERIDYRPDFLTASGEHIPPTWRIGVGANMAFRREVFDKVGYFDERLDAGAAGCGGDSEFWYRILALGWCCRYEPSAVVFHYHRRSERELAHQIRTYMRGHVATLLVQNQRYRDRRNLQRVFVTLPVWYGRKLLARTRNGKSEANAFVWQEIAGALAGVSYYLLRLRSTEAFPRGPSHPSFAMGSSLLPKGLSVRVVQLWREAAVKLGRFAAGLRDQGLHATEKLPPFLSKADWLYSGKEQLKLVWASTRGHRRAAPVLVVLGVGAAIAETLATSLVILFLYEVIGGRANHEISEGVLAHIFRFTRSLSGDDPWVLAALSLLFIIAKALLDLSYSLLTARVKHAVGEGARNAVYETYLAVPYGYLRSKDQGGLSTARATQSSGVAGAVQAFARLAANLCAILVFSVFLISIACPIFLAAIVGGGLLRQASVRVRQLPIRPDWLDGVTGPLNEVGYFLLLGLIAGIAVRFEISALATLCALGLLCRLLLHLRECAANLIKLAGMAPSLEAWHRSLHMPGGRMCASPPDSIPVGPEHRRAPDPATAVPGPQT